MYFAIPVQWGKVLAMIAIGLWMKADLMFRYCSDFKQFWKAAGLDVGYFGICSVVYIVASLL